MKQTIRPPAVAGTFYPNDKTTLLNEVQGYLHAVTEGEFEAVMAAIVPHAGWYYSGHVAGAVFGTITVPDRVIIIGPNHRGMGAPVALDTTDGWLFPFGVVPVDRELCSLLLEHSAMMEPDAVAHAFEHSLEVIVPFLYARNQKVRFAPICLGTHDGDSLKDLAQAVAKAAKATGALIVASTDMTHYLPDTVTRKLDTATIEVMETMDGKKLMDRVKHEGALCGGGAVAAVMAACKANGAKELKLVKYATSGDIEGKRDSVVGYGGFTIAA
ncbi:MAG: AmmeMemoRadiSam system protein B [Nitrospinae bacterium]|nr:AmmeMemoRadiSam system protein B [Nitrospinota bacterium]